MENLITQLQTALAELVAQRDTYKRQLDEYIQQAQRDSVSGDDLASFTKGFRACLNAITEQLCEITHYKNVDDYATICGLDVSISGDVESNLDLEDIFYDNVKLDLSDEDIANVYKALKEDESND